MSHNKNQIYRRKPKTFEDKVLGKGVLGKVAHILFYGFLAGTAIFAAGLSIVALSGGTITSVGIAFGAIATGSLLAGSLAFGRAANYFDDNNKSRRFERYVKAKESELQQQMKGMTRDEKIEFLNKERETNNNKIAELDKHFTQREVLKKLELEEERMLRQKRQQTWEDRVKEHAKIEEIDELEAVTRV